MKFYFFLGERPREDYRWIYRENNMTFPQIYSAVHLLLSNNPSYYDHSKFLKSNSVHVRMFSFFTPSALCIRGLGWRSD
jgi:hypothetical protein